MKDKDVPEMYSTLEYGTALEDPSEALAWLVDHGSRFGPFINGSFGSAKDSFQSLNPATEEILATLTQSTPADVDMAIEAARKAQPAWEGLSSHERAMHLYAMARMLQRNARLFAVMETLDNGKPIRESRDVDIPLAQRHFYHHAGLAQLMDDASGSHSAHGVCGQVIPWNFPLLMLAWKVAPALAAGNTVVLKPAEWTSLSALLFADFAHRAGLPPGVLNIVTGDGEVGAYLLAHPGIDKVAFTGSTQVGRGIRQATAGQGKALTLELGGKSPFIVFDDADQDSAIEGLVGAIWFNQGQVCCAGARLLVQESIAEPFLDRLRQRMAKLRVGDPLDKCIDIGAMVDPQHRARVQTMLDQCKQGQTFVPDIELPASGAFLPPMLVTGLSTADRLMQDEIFGPVLVSSTFRTPQDAVQVANNTRYGLAASVWSENINLALDVSRKLVAGVVWVNGANLFDAAAPFGGLRESGFGREGGCEGQDGYLARTHRQDMLEPINAFSGTEPNQGIDRTYKNYIGGKQTRPDGGYSATIFTKTGKVIAQAPIANRKDIRNAVEAGQKAVSWSVSTGHARAQVLYFLAENLSARSEEFARLINRMTAGRTGPKEVKASISRLFSWAAWADKFAGEVASVPVRALTLKLREPTGVIGVFCPDDAPLLGFVSVLGAALAMGNRVVVIASEPFPLAALEFVQILETSDVPPGVANVPSGPVHQLAPHLAGHMDVDAVWSFASADISMVIEKSSAANLKRTWVNNGLARDWFDQSMDQEFLDAATEVKTLWLPYGE